MIKWWKGVFDDLKPYDTLSMDNILGRYQRVLKTFDNYQGTYDEGYYFVNIHKSQYKFDELKALHDKYNSPTNLTKKSHLK